MSAAPGPDALVRERLASGGDVEGAVPSYVPAAAARREGAGTRAARGALVALAVLTAFGAAVRASGFSSLGFFRDDAWVALSAHQGLGTAVHMWVAAPGYFFVVRAFLQAGPHTTWWAQLPAFVAGVACIPAMYALVRHFRLSRVAALVAAGVVSLSPVATDYATRLKVYEADFLLTCVLLGLAETTRRHPGRRQVTVLALGSVLAFVCSASVAAVVAGAWLMVAWCTLRRPGPARRPGLPRHVVVGLAATAVGCGLVALVAYAHVSPTIGLWWPDAYVHHSSITGLVSSLEHVTWYFLAGLFGFSGPSTFAEALVVLLAVALAVAGVYRNAAMLAPALIMVVAYVGSAAHRVPLGTGRTDMYLYPVVLLLLAAGTTRVVRGGRAALTHDLSPHVARTGAVVGVALAVVVGGVVVARAVADRPTYPGVDITAIAGAISAQEHPGDPVFVSELERFAWADEIQTPYTVRFGAQWAPGFTVVSTDPRVFLVPSEYLEGGSRPAAWAASERRAHADRIWYVWSPPLAVFNPSYAALRADGWRPVRTLHATGISATLLIRAGS